MSNTMKLSGQSCENIALAVSMLTRALAIRSFDPRVHIQVAREMLDLAEQNLVEREEGE